MGSRYSRQLGGTERLVYGRIDARLLSYRIMQMENLSARIKHILRSRLAWLVIGVIVFVGVYAYIGDMSSKYSYKGGSLHIASQAAETHSAS